MNIRIADYLDYLLYNNRFRDFDTELIKELRGACGVKTPVKTSEDPENNAGYEEACESFRDNQETQRYESESYRLASGDYS